MKHWITLAIIVIVLPLSNALAVTINTNNVTSAEYIAFTTGATVQNFESVSGLTPLTTTAYTNGTPVPSSAQMHGQIPNLFFHSGGANPTIPPQIQGRRSPCCRLVAASREMPIRERMWSLRSKL